MLTFTLKSFILAPAYIRFAVKKTYLSHGPGVIVKRRERKVESSSSATTPSRERLFLIQMNGAMVGAKESGHHAACNDLSKHH